MKSGSATGPTAIATTPPVADHELLHVIGRGAYGEVWLARHTRLGTFRAVKIIHRDQFGDARPFQREFSGIQKYEPISRGHSNLVPILHVGGTDECFYYVMELADAVTNPNDECRNPKEIRSPNAENSAARVDPRASDFGLPSTFDIRHSSLYSPHTLRAELKRHGALPIDRVVEIGHALASALAHLHAHKLVHRDVKPSNVIFVGGVAKLADIGLVAGVDESRSLVGTEGYTPLDGMGTPSADCYALGKLLYELSTGHDRTAWPEPPGDLATRTDREHLLELNAVLHHACAPDPLERYANAEAMRADLELLQRGQSVKRQRSLQKLWRNSMKVAAALLILAIVSAAFVIVQRQFTPSDLYGYGRDSTNRLANKFCDKGLQILRGDNYLHYADAYTNFQQAIDADPHFARPYVGLLDLRLRHRVPSLDNLDPMTPEKWQQLADKLEDLAPDSAATALAKSIINFWDFDFPAARRHAEQAIKTSPKYELAHIWFGFMLMNWGWTDEARAEAETSETEAPSKATSYRLRGHTYYVDRRFTDAIHWYRQAIGMDNHEVPALLHIGQALQAMGDYTSAIATNETVELLFTTDESETRRHYDKLHQAFKEGRERGYWQEEWKFTKDKPNTDFYGKAKIQIHLGDTNAALNWLEQSFEAHERERDGIESMLTGLLFDECWDGIHDDPRFKELLHKVGFNKVMRPRKK